MLPHSRKKLPDFGRAAQPPPHTFTKRDQQILLTIYAYDGVLADYQIDRLFFHNRRQMYNRMSKLFHNGYVAKPNRKDRYSLDYTVFWLDKKGAEFVAQQQGIPLSELSWRKPHERWSQTIHDVTVGDIRITVTEALAALPGYELLEWIPSRIFWATPDAVAFTDSQGRSKKRFVRPDAYFHLKSGHGERERHSRLLLELDRRTEPNKRFVDEKVIPGIAYLKSSAYKERFGVNSGRWLVISMGAERVENMLKAAKKIEGADVFHYTTLKEALEPGAFFTKPIWRRSTRNERVALLTVS